LRKDQNELILATTDKRTTLNALQSRMKKLYGDHDEPHRPYKTKHKDTVLFTHEMLPDEGVPDEKALYYGRKDDAPGTGAPSYKDNNKGKGGKKGDGKKKKQENCKFMDRCDNCIQDGKKCQYKHHKFSFSYHKAKLEKAKQEKMDLKKLSAIHAIKLESYEKQAREWKKNHADDAGKKGKNGGKKEGEKK
jgi:hypothetical protein